MKVRPNRVYLLHECSSKTVPIIEYISRNSVSVRQLPVKKTSLQYGFSLQVKHQWPSKIKITIWFHSIGQHFDFMNPIQQKTNVLTKTFETIVGLACNIILQACQWYSGSKVSCLNCCCRLFFNCQKISWPHSISCPEDPTGMKISLGNCDFV